VPKTQACKLLFLLSGLKSVRRLLILLLSMAATSEFGQEPVLTMAMIRHVQPPVRKPAVIHNDSTANRYYYNTPAPRPQFPAAAANLDDQNVTDSPSDSHLEKQSNPNQRNLFQLVHKKVCADGHTGKWVDVAAGYGQIGGAEPGLEKNSVELEQPGRAYLKASFSF